MVINAACWCVNLTGFPGDEKPQKSDDRQLGSRLRVWLLEPFPTSRRHRVVVDGQCVHPFVRGFNILKPIRESGNYNKKEHIP